ncbi:MAG: ABC transporter permease, partial [Halobacteriaceae archaeon]
MTQTQVSQETRRLPGRWVLLWGIIYKRFLLLIRYPVNLIAQLFSIYIFFAVVFFGGKAAVSQIGGGAGALASTFDGLIVGWFLWTMSLTAYFGLAENIMNESQWGTLEQLYMSPYGFNTVMAGQVLANIMVSLMWGGVILFLMLITTGRNLSVNLLTIIPISILTIFSVIGIGFVFAGLALLYKRIENVAQIMQFALVGLIAAPVTGYSPLRYLPLVQGSAMLQTAMRKGVQLWEFSLFDVALLVTTAIVYAGLGYLVFIL